MEAITKTHLGRRGFLGASATVAGAGVVAATAGPAQAAGFDPMPYSATAIPNAAELHTLRRWTYGYTPAALAQLRGAGSPQAWFEAQLNPAAITESADAQNEAWWYCITASSDSIVQRDKDGVEPGWKAMQNYTRYAVLKRMTTNRPVLEYLAEFWEDHLYIPVHDDGVYPFRIDFGRKMRELALTSFEELLLASTTHPAMGCSLDNARSQKRAVNENLGRELLELHTVGQGQYSEDDVKNSAKILTGYRVEMWSTWKVSYDTTWHYVGPVQVMDFTHANASADGQAATAAYLSYLAHHPATARRICKKLAQRFIADEPSEALVQELTKVYLANDTQIKPVLRALFAHGDFWASAGQKVKNPTDELASVYRSIGVRFAQPSRDDAGANLFIWNASNLGYMPWSHPRPDGPPRRDDAWISPSRFLGSWDVHWGAAGGWGPSVETTWVASEARLPQASLSMGQLVDHLSRSMTGFPSSSKVLEACCIATDTTPTTTITSSHAVARWLMPNVLALVLNQPAYYLR